MTGSIHIDLFSTLDGVMQGPGGPGEDTDGGFAYGGWQAPIDDDRVGERVMAGIGGMDALLLGRRTYDIFAAYWPAYGDGPAAGIARKFNSIPKYVASRGAPDLRWEGAQRLGADLPAAIADLRERHDEVHVIGSVSFARDLVADGLFDVLNLWVYPIVLGAGKRLFPETGPARGLRLLEPPMSGPQGAVLLRYGPGSTDVAVGLME
jgi:dihydrofolate reductase